MMDYWKDCALQNGDDESVRRGRGTCTWGLASKVSDTDHGERVTFSVRRHRCIQKCTSRRLERHKRVTAQREVRCCECCPPSLGCCGDKCCQPDTDLLEAEADDGGGGGDDGGDEGGEEGGEGEGGGRPRRHGPHS